jgi:hypothetical protein
VKRNSFLRRKGVKRGKRELIFLQKKKKNTKDLEIGSVLSVCPPKTTKKGIFQRTFSRLRV